MLRRFSGTFSTHPRFHPPALPTSVQVHICECVQRSGAFVDGWGRRIKAHFPQSFPETSACAFVGLLGVELPVTSTSRRFTHRIGFHAYANGIYLCLIDSYNIYSSVPFRSRLSLERTPHAPLERVRAERCNGFNAPLETHRGRLRERS